MPIALPVSNIVNVQVVLSALQAQAPAINSANIVGTSNVIDTTSRQRVYSSLTGVATDFGTVAPEYLAASLWFGQSPQPTNLFISRWANVATSGQLIGGSVPAADVLISAWTSIVAGGFYIIIDGVPYAISGLNFSAVTNLNGVASVIQAAIRTATGGTQTVVYNSVYNNFIITDSSGTTGITSIIGFVAPSVAVGKYTFSGQPTANDTITIQGTVVTFVASGAVGNQVNIGASLAATLIALQTFLNASVDANLSLMTYLVAGSVIYLTSKATGTTGNAYTTTKVSTNITAGGATLTGGVAADISGMTGLTNTLGNGCYQAPGVAAESALSAVTLLDQQFGYNTYGLIVLGAVDADHQAIAAYVEGVAPHHYYGVTTQEAGVIVAGSTSDIAYVLKLLAYNHTAVQYSSFNQYAIASYLARILTTQWLGNNTTIDLMFKLEPGVVAENFNTNQDAAIRAKNCNAVVNYENGTAFIQYGTSCSGQFTDTIIGADWLAGEVQTSVFNVMQGDPYKIPQTDAGMNRLVAAAQAACEVGVTNGYLAPGQWNSSGFGTLNPGDPLTKGYYVWAPPVATQSQAVRQTRAGTVMQIAAKTAGAIQSDQIILNINQ